MKKRLLLSLLFPALIFFALVPGILSTGKVKAAAACYDKNGYCETYDIMGTCRSGYDYISSTDALWHTFDQFGCGYLNPLKFCCLPVKDICSIATDGQASCMAKADCQVNSDSAFETFNKECKETDSSKPVCCKPVTDSTACTLNKQGTCKDTCDTTKESSAGTYFDTACKNSGKGNACCVGNDKNKCFLSGGECSNVCNKESDKINDQGACDSLNSSKPVCCKTEASKNKCEQLGGSCKNICAKESDKINDSGICESIDGTQPFCCKDDGSGGEGNTEESDPQHYNYNSPVKAKSFTQLITNIMLGIQKTVGYLAVIFIVIGGIMYILSGGAGMTSLAKATITWALAGFAIAVAGPSLLKEVYTIVSTGGSSGASVIDNATPIKQIVANVLMFLLSGVGILAIIGFVVSAIMFITAAGNTSQAESARKGVTYTIIGIVLAGAGLIIVNQVIQVMQGNIH